MRSALALVALAGGAAGLAGGYVAHRVREDALRVRGSTQPHYPATIRAMSSDAVRLDPGGAPVSPALVALGLEWEGGRAELGAVVAAGRGGDVTRRVRRRTGSASPGTPARIAVTPWGRDPSEALGRGFEDITYAAPGGPTPAWWLDGSDDVCVIVVHGRGTDRAEGLRLIGGLGIPGPSALMIRYRNDPGSVDDGIARFGQTEWVDLAAAVREAAARGARRVVLAGISMGGAIVMGYLERAPHPIPVAGVILDSPVLSLRATIDAKAIGVGGPLARFCVVPLGRSISSVRDGIDWTAVDYLSRADELRVPVLLIHDRDDVLIPIATSDAFAAARPDLVEYRVTRGAGHTPSWNADPDGYSAAVGRFIEGLSAP